MLEKQERLYLVRKWFVTGKVSFVVSSHSLVPPRVGWVLANDLGLEDASDAAMSPCQMLNYVIDLSENGGMNEDDDDDHDAADLKPATGTPLFKVSIAGLQEVHGVYVKCVQWEEKARWKNSESGLYISYDEPPNSGTLGEPTRSTML
jgi:hypothetical protein